MNRLREVVMRDDVFANLQSPSKNGVVDQKATPLEPPCLWKSTVLQLHICASFITARFLRDVACGLNQGERHQHFPRSL